MIKYLTHWEIYKKLIKIFPLKLQADWDQSKFICHLKNRHQPCHRIFIMLDLEKSWFENQELTSNDLLIMHHPIVLSQTPTDQKMLQTLIKKRVPILMLHTNFDFHQNGMNFLMAQTFADSKLTYAQEHGYFVKLKKAMTVANIANLINEKHQCYQIVYDHYFKNQLIKNIQIILGSGASELDHYHQVKKMHRLDLYITGDMKWHDWQKARHLNLAVIDCHHTTEKIFVNAIKNIIKTHCQSDATLVTVPTHLKLVYL
ncbi:DUF34/Nif3 metal-binding family protein [[Mycoplasma] cavipharyngis]|uniref:Nif3-like dinuclear metal center hexameric protein n=1 Tax=[Mycoplasma] cavipharyngis TaxID=92757 RepID=UPI003703AE6B